MSTSYKKSAYIDLNDQEKSQLIFKEMKNSYAFWSIKKAVKDQINRSGITKTQQICDMIPKMMKDLNLESKIKNQVHEILDRNGYFNETSYVTQAKMANCSNLSELPEYFFDRDHEPVEHIDQAKKQWSVILKNMMLQQIRTSRKPFTRAKKTKKEPVKIELDATETLSQDDDASSGSDNMKELIPKTMTQAQTKILNLLHNNEQIYDHNTLYDQLTKITNSNLATNKDLLWGDIKLQLKTPSLEELRKKYSELSVTLRQIGSDEDRNFIEERTLIGERLLQKNYQPYLVQYAKRGVPTTIRCKVYKKILYAEIGQREIDHFENLTENLNSWETALDDMIKADIAAVCNDDKYFIFQDMIDICVQAFFRDRQVLDLMKSKPHAPVICLNPNDKVIGVFPPCGVIPQKRFSQLFAPLSFLSNSQEDCYFVFRSMYCKYFCHLNGISSHPQGILTQCKLFEELLQMYEPEVSFHLQQLGISPLKTVFPWITYCFVGVLEVDQIYILWDRIIGFESVEIVTLLAVSIMVFRANFILNVNSQDEFDELFADLSQMKVLPLIQHFLFASGIDY